MRCEKAEIMTEFWKSVFKSLHVPIQPYLNKHFAQGGFVLFEFACGLYAPAVAAVKGAMVPEDMQY